MSADPRTSSPAPLSHLAISASAGSGKTFQLAHRFIALVARGVPPERIVALTFSRKAAGEIFDSIITHLGEAAQSKKAAAEMTDRIGCPGLLVENFRDMLRRMLRELHHLHISTLDSFSIGVLKTFPMELGVSMDFEVMDNDGDAAHQARQEVLAHIFSPHHFIDEKARTAFRESFKQATFGSEEKTLDRTLETFFGEYHSAFQLVPNPESWGDETRIWPGGCAWLGKKVSAEDVVDKLLATLEDSGWPAAYQGRWRVFLEGARGYAPGAPLDTVEYLFKKLVAEVDALRAGRLELKLERTACKLSKEQCRYALALVGHIIAVNLRVALEQTCGIHRILDQYEESYDEKVRRRGRVTFDDAQYLLTARNRLSNGRVLSCDSDDEARLYIDYRLDGRLDHWLLDEFQDTSDLQWDVLQNLIDEVLQDCSGERTFFYVGDVKQAIYGWRGGNARLFGAILRRYAGRIQESPLDVSFRSCPPVIEAVNTVFGSLPRKQLPDGATRQWEDLWHAHEAAPHLKKQKGHVALLEPDSRNGKDKPTEEERYDIVARIVNQVQPLRRGLSVAVLTRSNRSGQAVVDTLREFCPDMPVVHEGRAAIVDSPVVAVLLALVQYAAHPGDTMAWRHLQMSPLGPGLMAVRAAGASLPLELLRSIQARGYWAFLREWGEKLDAACPLDGFGRRRLSDFLAAAREFDERGSRDVNAFCRFVENYTLHEGAADDAVRVMTIHQSKGLGFDIVILPDLQSGGLKSAGQIGLAVARDANTNAPEWALKMPRRLIAETDDVLAGQIQAEDEESCFDELCCLYVAMTRAKRALYMVTGFAGKTSTAVTPASLLKECLVGEANPTDGPMISLDGEDVVQLYEAGSAAWYEAKAESQELAPTGQGATLPPGFAGRASSRRRLLNVAPSSGASVEEDGGLLFGRSLRETLDFGTATHELFEHMAWVDDETVEDVIQRWEADSDLGPSVSARVAAHVREALAGEDIHAALSRPDGDVELWRERAFEVVLDDEWVTGIFDRVVVQRDRARILDFKTNDVSNEEELQRAVDHYRPQMKLYARALSRLLKLDQGRIETALIFTRPGRVVDL